MADTFFGINTGDPEIDSSVQVGSSTNSTDIEVRITNNDVGVSGQKMTRLEAYRKLEAIRDYITSALNVTFPVF